MSTPKRVGLAVSTWASTSPRIDELPAREQEALGQVRLDGGEFDRVRNTGRRRRDGNTELRRLGLGRLGRTGLGYREWARKPRGLSQGMHGLLPRSASVCRCAKRRW
jgi:hypothetical protein